MHIHRVRGKNLQEALERAARAHGEGALVLGHERSRQGDVTVAVAERPAAKRQAAAPEAEAAEPADPGLVELEARLLRHGASRALVKRVLLGVRKLGSKGTHAIDAGAEVLGRSFAVAGPLILEVGPTAVAFLGPTGSGKTTALAKLARSLTLQGQSVRLVTLDARRAGAAGELLAVGEKLGVPVSRVGRRSELDALLEATSEEVLLVDTPGLSPRDAKRLESLAHVLRSAKERGPLHAYWVGSAAASAKSLASASRAFGPLATDGAVLTHLDECEEPVPALEQLLRSRTPIAFLGDGWSLSEPLVVADADRLADLCLRGRMA